MVNCPHCSKRIVRVHRKPLEKILYSDMYDCGECQRRVGAYHHLFFGHFRFVFSRYSCCIRCGSAAVQRLEKRDRVDAFSSSPLAWVQMLVGAPVNRCSPCRLQYFDWRQPRPTPSPNERLKTNPKANRDHSTS
jgi:hypothetical protein